MSNFVPFSERHGLTPPDAPITIRSEAPDWLRELLLTVAYKSDLAPSQIRTVLCEMLLETPDANNWSEFPNVDGEVRNLLRRAQWFEVYDLIELLIEHLRVRRELLRKAANPPSGTE